MNTSESIKTNKTALGISKIMSNKLLGIISFAILTAVAAQVAIPAKPVPFTLQTLFVVLSGALLGSKKGAYSQMLYLGLGVMGLPVFAQTGGFSLGIADLLGPTGGYLLAFPIGAFVTGFIVEKNKSYISVAFAMFLGEIVINLTGAFCLGIFFLNNISDAIKYGALVFSFWTAVKVFAASSIYCAIKKNYK
jgi:biotin transport system substrate-specific component